jgi:hypothetical protein
VTKGITVGIFLRLALNTSQYESQAISPIAVGEKRIKDYENGLARLRVILKEFTKTPIFIVDNTLEDLTQIPLELKSLIPENWIVVLTHSNIYGRHNKGAGDIETIRCISQKLTTFDYVIFFEPRLILEKTHILTSLIQSPRNSLWLENKNFCDFILRRKSKSVSFGFYSIQPEKLLSFVGQVDLERMVDRKESVEDIFFDFLKKEGSINIKRWGWHSLRREVSTDSYQKY